MQTGRSCCQRPCCQLCVPQLLALGLMMLFVFPTEPVPHSPGPHWGILGRSRVGALPLSQALSNTTCATPLALKSFILEHWLSLSHTGLEVVIFSTTQCWYVRLVLPTQPGFYEQFPCIFSPLFPVLCTPHDPLCSDCPQQEGLCIQIKDPSGFLFGWFVWIYFCFWRHFFSV